MYFPKNKMDTQRKLLMNGFECELPVLLFVCEALTALFFPLSEKSIEDISNKARVT